MKAIILCIFALCLVTVSKAQSITTSLNITLTDVQSVTFNNVVATEITPATHSKLQNGSLQVLSLATSQIKKIISSNTEYDRLYKEFYAAGPSAVNSQKGSYRMAANSTSSKTNNSNPSNLVIYQIDPR